METLAPELAPELIATLSAYELERGKPMPSLNHGAVQANIVFEMKTRYRDQFRLLSEINVEIAGRVLVPDIGVFPSMALDLSHDTIVVTQTPLTTIEILSPRQALDDLIDKADAYLAAGVRSCWVVMPKLQGVAVFSAPGTYIFFRGAEVLRDPATGVELPLATLFE